MTDTGRTSATLRREEAAVITEPFSTTSGDYFAILLSEWLPRYGWTLFIPILATAGVGCLLHDERWLLVALMLVFIVAPMVMSFLYTYYMLTPEARRAVLHKRVEIHPGQHLRLIYLHPDSRHKGGENDAKNGAENSAEKEKGEDDEYVYQLPPDEVIPWTEIIRIRRTSRFTIYFLRGQRMQFLLIPHTAFSKNTVG